MSDVSDIIGELVNRLPPEAKASTEAQQVVAAAVRAGIAAATQLPPSPVAVQRVDEYEGSGQYRTTWEVTDRRLPKLERIVGSFLTEQAARAAANRRAPIGG